MDRARYERLYSYYGHEGHHIEQFCRTVVRLRLDLNNKGGVAYKAYCLLFNINLDKSDPNYQQLYQNTRSKAARLYNMVYVQYRIRVILRSMTFEFLQKNQDFYPNL